MFLSPTGAGFVLWVHILSACVWIGGQVTIAILMPVLRVDPQILAASARRYAWIAWGAFVLLVGTGVLNIHNAGISISDLEATVRGRTLILKLLLVVISGVSAAAHSFIVAPRAGVSGRAAGRMSSALLAFLSLGAALAAALYGVVIAES